MKLIKCLTILGIACALALLISLVSYSDSTVSARSHYGFAPESMLTDTALVSPVPVAYVVITSSDPGMAQDLAALIALFNATNGDGWTNKAGWLTGLPYCDWHGVICNDENRVEELHLPSNNLLGYIPAEIGDLSYLEDLRLHANKLSGMIPSEIGDLGNLRILRLSENQFGGIDSTRNRRPGTIGNSDSVCKPVGRTDPTRDR